MGEQEIREILEEKFRRKLLRSKKAPKFEFVRAINSKIISGNRQDCQSYDGRLLKHLSGQGPLYIRATTEVSSTLNMYTTKGEEGSDDSSVSNLDDDEVDEQIMKMAMFAKEVKEPKDVIHVSDNDPSADVGFSSPTLPSTCRENETTNLEAGPLVLCPTCDGQFRSSEIEEHADLCADSAWNGSEQLAYANLMSNFENDTDTDLQHEEIDIPTQIEEKVQDSSSKLTQEVSRDKLMKAVRELEKNVGMSTNRINIQRKTVFADYISTRKRRPWFKPEDRIKVVFVGEPSIDDGGPRREFFTDALEQLKNRLFDSNGVPVESTVALTEETFKLGAELMVMSVVQGGPAPNFMSSVIYDVIARGLGQTQLSLDMLAKGNFNTIATKIESASTESQLHSVLLEDEVLDVLSKVGYRGVPSKETLACKEKLIRSIVIKSLIEPKLGMINQLKEGLNVCGMLDAIQKDPLLFKSVFVASDMFKVTSEQFLDELKVTYSEKQVDRMAEATTFKHFCDLVEHLYHNGIVEHNLKLRDLLRFITGSYQLPPLGLPEQIDIKFFHGCADGCQCRPTASTCKLWLSIPVHASSFENMKALMTSAMLEGFGFGNL